MEAIAQLNSALVGRYAIDREIGVGGMATVYLARDLKHNRKVALKVLKPELGAVLGVERFLAEIQTTASLQHPNLLPLFDSGEAKGEWSDAPGLLFYVMPFVEGESLRARLDREKQLPVDEAFASRSRSRGALGYAHEQGVIHRDLKPENILIQAGQPVLADFGIALAVANAGGARITQTGLSLGTPQYMSPEQATGDRAIDGRTDIYSLAAVLYEMLTGDPPHTGSTAQAIIARVLTDKPRSARASRETVPDYVDAALDCALAKLPADRFATAREFAGALGGAGATPRAYTAAHASTAGVGLASRWRPRSPHWRRSRRGVGFDHAPARASSARAFRSPFPTVPASARRSPERTSRSRRTDRNSSTLAVPGAGQLFVRPINELDAHPLRGTNGATNPRFSPDGKWVAYIVGNTLKKISLAGGAPILIADTADRASWGDNGEIVMERGFTRCDVGLWRVSAGGGAPVNFTDLTPARHETAHTWPFVLPGSEAALLTVERGGPGGSELAVVRFSDGKVIPLTLNGADSSGRESAIPLQRPPAVRHDSRARSWPQPFDLKRLRVMGDAVTVLDSLVVKGGGATEAAVSSNGTLVFVDGDNRRQMVLVDHAGAVRPLLPSLQRYDFPRFSPTGDRLAVEITEPGSARKDIWVYSLPLHTMTRLTHDGKSRVQRGRPMGGESRGPSETMRHAEVRWQPWTGADVRSRSSLQRSQSGW